MRDVTLVIGPPCAGKTTWVQQHQQHGDIVIDWDHLAIEAGSPVAHDHPKVYRAAANARRQELEQHVAGMADGRAFIIRTEPRRFEQAALARRLDAHIEIIDPGIHTCLARAAADGRDTDVDAAILRWYGVTWGARCYDPKPKLTGAANPRRTAEWRAVRRMVLRGNPPCHRGHPMRYGVPYNRAHPDPLYPTVDHIVPVSQGGAWYDLANLRPACWEHNTDHQAEPVTEPPAVREHRTSEDW